MAKIIDCFIFYNELELLKYRFNILADVVDYFVIVESTHTFTGQKKSLLYDENKDMFAEFRHKIVHVIIDDFPYKYPNIDFLNGNQWQNEHFQRNNISRGFNRIENVKDDDLFIISDVDEIPDPSTIKSIRDGSIKVDLNSLCMDMYYYNLNSKIIAPWTLPKILSNRKYRELNVTIDNIRQMNCPEIIKGGWHLSYFGDSSFIQNKIVNFSHQELNQSIFTDLLKIEKRVHDCTDLYDRPGNELQYINICNNTYLPDQYDTYLNGYFTS